MARRPRIGHRELMLESRNLLTEFVDSRARLEAAFQAPTDISLAGAVPRVVGRRSSWSQPQGLRSRCSSPFTVESMPACKLEIFPCTVDSIERATSRASSCSFFSSASSTSRLMSDFTCAT